mgnify:CR=1 FL=1
MPGLWDRLDEKVQENAAGILGTIAFHLVLISVFLAAKISNERKLMRDMILVDFEEERIEESPETETPDPVFEEQLARYLEEHQSNIPVNLARQVDREGQFAEPVEGLAGLGVVGVGLVGVTVDDEIDREVARGRTRDDYFRLLWDYEIGRASCRERV